MKYIEMLKMYIPFHLLNIQLGN